MSHPDFPAHDLDDLGDLGPPQGIFTGKDGKEAIAFALQIDDHYDMREFLQGWMVGDTREWPEFKPDLVRS